MTYPDDKSITKLVRNVHVPIISETYILLKEREYVGCSQRNKLNELIEQSGRAVLSRAFDSSYWQKIEEESGYPEAFVQALTEAGWLAALIPEEYGGSGTGLTEVPVILEEINRSGANSGACHARFEKRYYEVFSHPMDSALSR